MSDTVALSLISALSSVLVAAIGAYVAFLRDDDEHRPAAA
jgi:hypothetical protein